MKSKGSWRKYLFAQRKARFSPPGTQGFRKELETRFLSGLKDLLEHCPWLLDDRPSSPARNDAPVVLSYLSYGSEPPTFAINQYLLDAGYRLMLPIGIDAEQTRWGVLLPEAHDRQIYEDAWSDPPVHTIYAGCEVDEVAWGIIPGLAIDKAGNRLGKGAGWYDRALVELSGQTLKRKNNLFFPTFGLVYADEVVEALPVEPTDQKMTGYITESSWAVFG